MNYIERKRKIIMMLLFACGVINYLDRSALSISAGHIASEFALSSAEMGIIFASFSIGYAAFNLIGGMAADKFGPKDTLLVAVIIWSLFSGALIFAVGFLSILIIRIIFGMAEGPLSTTTNKTIDMWYPHNKKTSIMGICSSGTPLGAAVSGPIVGYITLSVGWRESFVVITIIGLIWAFLWYKLVDKKPAEKTDEGEVAVKEDISPTKIRVPLKKSFYLKKATILFTALAFFAYNYILFFFLTWFPSYLQKGLGMGLEQVSLIAVIPWTFGFVALAMGGIVADKVTALKEWKDPLTPKRLVIGICLLISGAAVIIAASTANFFVIIGMITVSVFALYFTGGIYWGVVNDIVDSSNVGSIGGAMHAIGNCAGILGPSITGFIVYATDSFVPAFILAGTIGVLGALGALFNVKRVNVTQQELELNKK